MRIGEVAKDSGVTVDTVRFYERVGVLPPPERRPSGYRDYAPNTVERIRLTRELQAIGFTLADVVDALAAHDAGGATCESERWRLEAVLGRVDAKLAELNAVRHRIVQECMAWLRTLASAAMYATLETLARGVASQIPFHGQTSGQPQRSARRSQMSAPAMASVSGGDP